jgi:hypothetical protein
MKVFHYPGILLKASFSKIEKYRSKWMADPDKICSNCYQIQIGFYLYEKLVRMLFSLVTDVPLMNRPPE